MAEKLAERYRRLLLLIPYVLQNQGIHIDALSEHFGVSTEQLREDLGLIFVCGLPGYGPGDLIEVDVDGDLVTIRAADYFSQPQRITAAEGLMLYAAAIALGAASGDRSTSDRAMAALEKALGVDRLDSVSFDLGEPDNLEVLRKAVNGRKRVLITYRSQSKDEETTREVDPWGLVLSSGRWYVVGWCHKVDDERLFLVDRIRHLEVTKKKAVVPEGFKASEHSELYTAGEDAFRLVMDLSPRAIWVKDYYKIRSVEPLEDGWSRIEMDASGTARFVKLILRLGPHARLIGPEDVVRQVEQTACEMLEKYR